MSGSSLSVSIPEFIWEEFNNLGNFSFSKLGNELSLSGLFDSWLLFLDVEDSVGDSDL